MNIEPAYDEEDSLDSAAYYVFYWNPSRTALLCGLQVPYEGGGAFTWRLDPGLASANAVLAWGLGLARYRIHKQLVL